VGLKLLVQISGSGIVLPGVAWTIIGVPVAVEGVGRSKGGFRMF
jgi:hypothetical protein